MTIRDAGARAIAMVRAWVESPIRFIGSAIILGLIIGIVCRSNRPDIPERERTSIDSLTATHGDFTRRIDTLVHRETLFVQQAAHATAVATQSHEAADSLRTVAITLEARAEEARDTFSLWRAAALTFRRESDSLRVEVDTLRTARDAEKAARLEADARAAEEKTRRIAAEDLIPRLAKDVRNAKGGFFQRLANRVGVQVGYAVTVAPDGGVHHGPALMAGVKVWP